MKMSRIFLVAGLCAAGFLSGFAGKRLTASQPEALAKSADQGPARTRATARDAADTPANAKVKPAPVKTSTLRSTDTLETLAELDAESLYSRLALWMMDASEQDIAAYWETVREKKDRPNDITDLVFINWAQYDPEATEQWINSLPAEDRPPVKEFIKKSAKGQD